MLRLYLVGNLVGVGMLGVLEESYELWLLDSVGEGKMGD